MEKKQWDSKVDIFSFGALLYFMLFKKEKMFYIEILKSQDDFQKSMNIELSESKFENKEFFKSVLLKCFSKDPVIRPSATDLKKLFQ